tara:strand:- start:67 stop:342 length:276 start_codon:yes stop_codon:yes gene_type:complete
MTNAFIVKLFYTDNNNLKYKTFKIENNTSIKKFIRKFSIHNIIKKEDFDIGVYGQIKDLDYIIKPNDRLELYVKIITDPKVRRKNIAKSDS